MAALKPKSLIYFNYILIRNEEFSSFQAEALRFMNWPGLLGPDYLPNQNSGIISYEISNYITLNDLAERISLGPQFWHALFRHIYALNLNIDKTQLLSNNIFLDPAAILLPYESKNSLTKTKYEYKFNDIKKVHNQVNPRPQLNTDTSALTKYLHNDQFWVDLTFIYLPVWRNVLTERNLALPAQAHEAPSDYAIKTNGCLRAAEGRLALLDLMLKCLATETKLDAEVKEELIEASSESFTTLFCTLDRLFYQHRLINFADLKNHPAGNQSDNKSIVNNTQSNKIYDNNGLNSHQSTKTCRFKGDTMDKACSEFDFRNAFDSMIDDSVMEIELCDEWFETENYDFKKEFTDAFKEDDLDDLEGFIKANNDYATDLETASNSFEANMIIPGNNHNIDNDDDILKATDDQTPSVKKYRSKENYDEFTNYSKHDAYNKCEPARQQTQGSPKVTKISPVSNNKDHNHHNEYNPKTILPEQLQNYEHQLLNLAKLKRIKLLIWLNINCQILFLILATYMVITKLIPTNKIQLFLLVIFATSTAIANTFIIQRYQLLKRLNMVNPEIDINKMQDYKYSSPINKEQNGTIIADMEPFKLRLAELRQNKQETPTIKLINSKNPAFLSTSIPSSSNESRNDRAYILKTEFILGTDPSGVDYLLPGPFNINPTAKIIYVDNNYLLVAMNLSSVSLNGKKLKPLIPYKIPCRSTLRLNGKVFYFNSI